jgi:hypothetical protein
MLAQNRGAYWYEQKQPLYVGGLHHGMPGKTLQTNHDAHMNDYTGTITVITLPACRGQPCRLQL